MEMESNLETATFGTGCFWCTEAIFQQVNGVQRVESGYSGGDVENPTYNQVCSGQTGHAECLNIYFDPTVISFKDLLEAFWYAHDPTTFNRQGNDVGTQYRSVIFYHDENQKEQAQKSIKEMNQSGNLSSPIVTTLEPYNVFYKAENYHQDYFTNNSRAPYCQYVVRPKLEKFRKHFAQGASTD